MLQHFVDTLDFKLFYKFIETLGSEISVLRIPVINKMALKSNHYWLMQVLGRMPKLHTVKFHRNNANVGQDFFKFMGKGMSYMQKEGRQFKKMSFNEITGSGRSGDQFYSVLKYHPNLISLNISNIGVTLAQDEAKAIGKILADYKFIRELDVSGTNLNLTTAKEIADGLMRAKALEIFKCKNNISMGKTLDTIIYNLAFSPKIKMIDLSNCGTVSKDTAEAVYKLLKISGAIELLVMRETGVSAHLSEDFFKALGENKTLSYLNLDEKSAVTQTQINLLAKALAMNTFKNGSLEALSIRTWMSTYKFAEGFF